MASLSVRGIDAKTSSALKRRAAEEDSSVNTLIVVLIQQGLGLLPRQVAPSRYDDMDALAGTWTQREAAAFERATQALNKVDPELWK